MPITAKVILDSISPKGHRLTTMELRYPKFIHGEFMTHRVFSRNASSSRAIPTKKYLEEASSRFLRASPVHWGKNQKGMQAQTALSESEKWQAEKLWEDAASDAVQVAERMLELGVHKQTVNRLLEPFLHIQVVVSSTEWQNFFGLRLHADAQPEMRKLAQEMWLALNQSIPRRLELGEWHLPYVGHMVADTGTPISEVKAVQVSVARCARVSYKSHETGKESTVEEDLRLFQQLLSAQPIHASPAEHQATPAQFDSDVGLWTNTEEWGNFYGWRQFRKMLPDEAEASLPEGYHWKE